MDRVTEPGVYRSDVDGHVFTVTLAPTTISCITCHETCCRTNFKSLNDFRIAAQAFTGKHGFINEKIANNIVEILPITKPN